MSANLLRVRERLNEESSRGHAMRRTVDPWIDVRWDPDAFVQANPHAMMELRALGYDPSAKKIPAGLGKVSDAAFAFFVVGDLTRAPADVYRKVSRVEKRGSAPSNL